MRTVKINNVVIPDIPAINPEYESRAVPAGMPKLNFMAVMYGAMGQGKSVSLLQMLKMYDKTKSYDRIIWWSPTLCHEPKGKAFLEGKKNFELIYYEKFNEADFINETERMKADIEGYREYLRRLKLYEKWVRNDFNLDHMTYDEIWELDDMGWEKPTTDFKWGFPSFGIVFDDCIAQKGIFSQSIKSATSNFFVAHRHYSCCVWITSQVHSNGVPRQIRGVISLWVLFKCRSKELQEGIAKELAFKCDKDVLLAAWDFATQKPHSFLFINQKENELNNMFRVGFTEQIILDDIKDDKEKQS